MGGHLNAYTSREQTCYYAKVGHVAEVAGLNNASHGQGQQNMMCRGWQALPELAAAYGKCMLGSRQHAVARFVILVACTS